VTVTLAVTPAPRFEHLLHLSDERGTFEHARFGEARPEHGYCTDDVARVLVVATRQPDPMPAVRQLAEVSLRFLGEALGFEGHSRNRMDHKGRWRDRPGLDDCWGRSIWALGTAAAQSDTDSVRQTARSHFERAARRRSPWPRAMAYAALGAAEVLSADPDDRTARHLLTAAAEQLPAPRPDATWPWPEERLSYANAVLPEAMIAAGAGLRRDDLLRQGLQLLAWLLEHESGEDGHLSVTPVGGAGAGDVGGRFDQQPIEVAALAEACARAAAADPTGSWERGVMVASAWFLGDNDGGHVMWDAATGGGFDGLQASGPNLNQGAESTLAVLATLQHGRRLVPVPA
jgi:hypothetical protein